MAGEMFTPEQVTEAMEAMANSSSTKQKKIMKMINSGLDLGAVFMDLGIAGSQIRTGERLRGDIQRPETFTPSRDRSLLQERIRSSQRGLNDVSQDLAPAELANLDQYLADIGNARIASGGQASIFGSMGNAAAMRRRAGGMQISALGSQIKRQNRGELNQLIGMDLADRNAYEGRKLTANELALQRYYKEAEDAAGVEAAGRSNQRESIHNMLPSLSQGIESIGGLFNKGKGRGQDGRVAQTIFSNDASPAETMGGYQDSIDLQLGRS
jgi:hypothetical protein